MIKEGDSYFRSVHIQCLVLTVTYFAVMTSKTDFPTLRKSFLSVYGSIGNGSASTICLMSMLFTLISLSSIQGTESVPIRELCRSNHFK